MHILQTAKGRKKSQYLNLIDLMQRNKTLSLFWFLIGSNLLQNSLRVVRLKHRAEKKVRVLTWVKTFDDCCGVYEISSAQDAHEVRVELGNLYPGRPMHLVTEEQQTCAESKGGQVKTLRAGRAGGSIRGLQFSPMQCGPFGKKICCLFDCVKETSSFMLI